MTQNSINVTASTSKPIKVNVTASESQGAVTLSQDTSAYNAEIARQWAISDKKVLQEDYSSKYYANKAKDSENSAKNYANVAETAYNIIQDSVNGVIADIETARIDAVDNITTVKSESIASVETKGNEVLSTVNAGIAEINSTKTTAVNTVNISKNEALNAINQIGVGNLANKDLSNLSAIGEARFASGLNDKITNCILEAPNGVATLSGLTITVKQGLKFLIPNGRNEDGTLNNIEKTLEQDIIHAMGNAEGSYFMFWYEDLNLLTGWGGQYVISENQPLTWEGQYIMWYNPATNLYKRSDNGGDYYTTQVIYMGVLRKDGGQPITIFEPIQPFRAVDYSEYLDTPRIIETYVYGYSGYRIWSPDQTGRKRCQQWGSIRDTSGSEKTITFLKPFADATYFIVKNVGTYYSGNSIARYESCYNLTATGFKTYYNTDYGQNAYNRWYADGYVN